MNNFKYNIINILATSFLAFVIAIFINQIIKFQLIPDAKPSKTLQHSYSKNYKKKTFDEYQTIFDSSFFEKANIVSNPTVENNSGMTKKEFAAAILAPPTNLNQLKLLGTITGPRSVSRAMIKKRGEKEADIVRLWQETYGYKLVRIDSDKVYLKNGEQIEKLYLFGSPEQVANKTNNSKVVGGKKINKDLSRAELKQHLSSLDEASKGLSVGPYRKNGEVIGYKLYKVRSYNILYKLGARSGDIVKRINGHPINSTERLFQLWQNLLNESKITIDLQRGNNVVTYDFNIKQ